VLIFVFVLIFFADEIMASSLPFTAFAFVILSAAAQDSVDEESSVGPPPSSGKNLNQPFNQSLSLLQTIVRR